MLEVAYSIARRLKRSNKFPVIRTLLNSMYYDPRMITIKMKNFDFVEVDGCKFYVNDQIDSIQRITDNPWFANIKPSDIVLDIGANIGAVTIPLAKVAKKVYAVEPLFTEELEQNIKLNLLNNVEIIKYGIGPDADKIRYEFGPRRGIAPSIKFNTLMKRVGKIDFIKIDGEGCEWSIDPEQLDNTREIRVEFHMRRRSYQQDRQTLDKWLEWLRTEGYRYTLEKGEGTSPCVPFSECVLLNATRSSTWD